MSGDQPSESQLRRPDAPKPQVGSPAGRSPLWGVVMALLLLGWLVAVPRLAFRAVITSSTFLGESPSVEDVRNSEHLMAWAAVLAVILPATGLIVGLWLGARVMSWVFGVALVIGLAFSMAAGSLASLDSRHLRSSATRVARSTAVASTRALGLNLGEGSQPGGSK